MNSALQNFTGFLNYHPPYGGLLSILAAVAYIAVTISLVVKTTFIGRKGYWLLPLLVMYLILFTADTTHVINALAETADSGGVRGVFFGGNVAVSVIIRTWLYATILYGIDRHYPVGRGRP